MAIVLALALAWLGQLLLTQQSAVQLQRDQLAMVELAWQSTRQELEAERILTHRRLESLRSQLAEARAQRDASGFHTGTPQPVGTLSPDNGTTFSLLTPAPQTPPGPVGIVAWDAGRQEGIIQVSHLPVAGPDGQYLLWVVDSQLPDPVVAAIFDVDPASKGALLRFVPRQDVHTPERYLITREPKGDATRPEGPVMLSGN